MTKPAHYSALRLVELSMNNYYDEASALMDSMENKKLSAGTYRLKRAAVRRHIQAMTITQAGFSRYIYDTFNRRGRPIPKDIVDFNGIIATKQSNVVLRLNKLPSSI